MNLDFFKRERRFEYLLEEPQLSESTIEEKLKWCLDHPQYIDTVFMNPSHVALAERLLETTAIRIAVGISYPLGGLPIELAIHEAQNGIKEGAHQVELVLPAGRIRGGERMAVQAEVQAFYDQLGQTCAICLIANLALLDSNEKTWCILLAAGLGVGLRTNTGYETSESIADICLARQTVKGDLVITACGGVNKAEVAIDLIQAGATRVATSQLPEVISGLETLFHVWKANPV